MLGIFVIIYSKISRLTNKESEVQRGQGFVLGQPSSLLILKFDQRRDQRWKKHKPWAKCALQTHEPSAVSRLQIKLKVSIIESCSRVYAFTKQSLWDVHRARRLRERYRVNYTGKEPTLGKYYSFIHPFIRIVSSRDSPRWQP